MGSLIEPFIIYAVLFLPDFGPAPALPAEAPVVPFHLEQELGRVLAGNLPSLLLLWYLVFVLPAPPEGRKLGGALPRPAAGDLQSLFIALPGLLAAGIAVSLGASFFPGAASGAALEAPASLAGWAIVILSCVSTGYLEETYFRHYLFSRFALPGWRTPAVMLLSSALFALCHLYEGPWGAANAFLAGMVLAAVYRRYRSLHGIAWAHGLYNAVVYLTGI